MKQCTYCNRCQAGTKHIVHLTGCPQIQKSKKLIYNQGWDDGRAGKPRSSKDPTYVMGYGNGECSAEEAENGFQASGY